MKEIVFINEIVINDVYNLYSNRPCLISVNFQFSVVGTKMFYKILVILFTCIIYNWCASCDGEWYDNVNYISHIF